jgi:hypothetical protein
MGSPIPGTLRNITIKPGTPTLLGSIVDGSLIVNQSTTDAIWLAGQSSVQPGVGLRVGALGSITWQTNSSNANVWGCVDAGGANNITLTITDQAVNPDSPLDVAAALIAQGIPSKLLVTNIGTFSIPGLGSLTVPADLTPYSSIYVFVQYPAVPTPQPLYYGWQIAGVGFGQVNVDAMIPDLMLSQCRVLIPVLGNQLAFNNTGNTNAGTVTLIGFNRSLVNTPVASAGNIFTIPGVSGGFSSVGCRWDVSLPSPSAGQSIKYTLTDGIAPQGMAWMGLTIGYPSAPATPPRWQVTLFPSGLTAGNTARQFMTSGTLQQGTQSELAGRQYRFNFMAVLPAMIYDIYITLTDAPPAGQFTSVLYAIPAGGFFQ